MRIRTIATALLFLGTITVTACASGSPPSTQPTQGTTPPAAGPSVTISNFQFAPANITVKAGTTVTWTNADSVAHTVTGDTGGPASGQIPSGQSYSYTFTTPGTFSYHCSIHPTMAGTVTVTP